jgi:predicted nucleic acid-binding protein
MPDAVSDSSPLIHLAKIEALEIISRLYSRILIPPAVWREVVEESDGRPGAVEIQKAVAAGWMVKQAAKNETLIIPYAKLWITEKLRRLRLQPNCIQNRSSWTTN